MAPRSRLSISRLCVPVRSGNSSWSRASERTLQREKYSGSVLRVSTQSVFRVSTRLQVVRPGEVRELLRVPHLRENPAEREVLRLSTQGQYSVSIQGQYSSPGCASR